MMPGIRAVETPASCVWLDGPALVANVYPNPLPGDAPWVARWMSRRGRMAAWVGRGGGWQARACWSYPEAVAAVEAGLGITPSICVEGEECSHAAVAR